MIRTKASIAKQATADSTFQLVKFDSQRSRLPKTAPPQVESKNKSESDDSEFERIFGDGGPSKKKKLKKGKKEVTYESARKEIINFGIAGSKVNEKMDLNQQLAIKLGAKPHKKPARNYKEILEEKRKAKEAEKSSNMSFGSTASLQNRNQKKKFRRKDDGLLTRYGRVEKDDKKKEFSGKRKR